MAKLELYQKSTLQCTGLAIHLLWKVAGLFLLVKALLERINVKVKVKGIPKKFQSSWILLVVFIGCFHEYLLGIFWKISYVFLRCFVVISWVFLWCFLGISQVFSGLSEMFLRSFFGILSVFFGCFPRGFKKFLGWIYRVGVSDVSLVFIAVHLHLNVTIDIDDILYLVSDNMQSITSWYML